MLSYIAGFGSREKAAVIRKSTENAHCVQMSPSESYFLVQGGGYCASEPAFASEPPSGRPTEMANAKQRHGSVHILLRVVVNLTSSEEISNIVIT